MGGRKLLVNKTNKNLVVRLLVRKGANPANGIVQRISVKLPAKSKKKVSYGNSRNIYLQGLRLQWNDKGVQLRKRQVVVKRGSWWDDVLNTNSILTIGGVGRARIKGSN